MAARKRKPVTKNRKNKTKRTWFFRNEKFRFILGVLVLLVSAYLLIAFISFLFYGAADQSKFDIEGTEYVLDSSIKVQNKAGKTGAWFAEKIINQGFGLASFIFIYLLLITGIKILGRNLVAYRGSMVFSLLLVVWLSVTLGMVFSKTDAGSFMYMGGQYGFVISTWLSSLIGESGLILLLFLSALTLVILRFEKAYSGITRMFGTKDKTDRKDAEKDIAGEETSTVEELPETESISKVIDGDADAVTAIFGTDAEESPEDNDILMPVEKSSSKEDEPDEDLELTVSERTTEDVTVTKQTSVDDLEDYDPTLELSKFKFPTFDLLEDHASDNSEVTNEELVANKNKIVETLRHYKIEITKIRATIGPTITLYEIVPAPGIRISKIKNLEDDIALSLAALGIRIIAPIPGRGTIGIEVPNQHPEVVSMRSILTSKRFRETTAELPVALGKTISNETYLFDLVKMPHILVAGATGQGKSVGINVIITSLLYKKHPSQLKFVFIDPKKVELNLYSILEKHYLAKLPNEEEPVITDIQKVKYTLNSINVEMDERYDLLKKAHARNIKEYNKKFISRNLNPEKGNRFMPYIVVVIDEFADLITTAGKEIELPIARIAQLARAVG
ncbi:MAG TPA: DNA translocase FtsK 4TM domain-containing protein, partial [Prolixibacteraceae bacterium]|nr:DNA translocase FtsK 4TM domain-containing protein [Prolixibacteraceae bacterium]